MLRKIVQIDEYKCNGCGLCAKACHEGAIELVNGKAKLISDEYCDGLGDCLPECPTAAITIVEREAGEYSQEAVDNLKEQKLKKDINEMPCGCPGHEAKLLSRKTVAASAKAEEPKLQFDMPISELRQWPVQMKLINPAAPYLQKADLLVAADCTAYAYANFHRDFIKGHITMIGCPKLDDVNYYIEKLTNIISSCNLKSITVVRMEVPCCGGIVNAVKKAMLQAQEIIPYKEVIIGTDGSIIIEN